MNTHAIARQTMMIIVDLCLSDPCPIAFCGTSGLRQPQGHRYRGDGVCGYCRSRDRRWFTVACGRMVVGVVAAEEHHGNMAGTSWIKSPSRCTARYPRAWQRSPVVVSRRITASSASPRAVICGSSAVSCPSDSCRFLVCATVPIW